jgi:FkbM family methyltransferase
VTPDNDVSTAPFGAFAPTAAQAAVIRLVQRSRLKRGAFRPSVSRLVNLLRAGPIDAQYHGASFRLYHTASATDSGALFYPDYNSEELSFLCAQTPVGGVFVDIGANIGTFALTLAQQVGQSGTVIAVEPHPLARARLIFNRDASRLPQVRIVAAAAGPSDGELLIETGDGNLGASHVVTGNASRNAIRVPSMTLRRILNEAGVAKVDTLKIDIEGFEDRVLIGFFAETPQTLWPHAVVIEHRSQRDWQQDCIADMIARGYSRNRKTRSNTFLARP